MRNPSEVARRALIDEVCAERDALRKKNTVLRSKIKKLRASYTTMCEAVIALKHQYEFEERSK